jgi:hypothetical protein
MSDGIADLEAMFMDGNVAVVRRFDIFRSMDQGRLKKSFFLGCFAVFATGFALFLALQFLEHIQSALVRRDY